MSYKLFLALILTIILESNGSRILGIFPMYGKSHMMFFESLFKGLARQGHQVDIVSNFPLHKPYPNYTDLEIPPLSPNLVNGMTLDFMEKSFQEINMVYYMAGDLGNKICQKGFETPVLQNLIKTQHSPAYDLVIVELQEVT
ncbi:GSCOCG00004991001-RA-CDS [Cotesia congregata]|nr:GSCOCG00004991001-RA-CDS [Cotesia congregata]